MAINREDWVRSVVPSGTVIAFAGATPPTGWLLCNGSAISRAAYPALFTAISVAHGSGDGSTTFHLPDYQGRFLRGVANGSANDPDRASRTHPVTSAVVGDVVGSVQGHANESHTHIQDAHQHVGRGRTSDPAFPIDGSIGLATDTSLGINASSTLGALTRIRSTTNAYDAITPTNQNSGGNETRPKNANVNYIIKA